MLYSRLGFESHWEIEVNNLFGIHSYTFHAWLATNYNQVDVISVYVCGCVHVYDLYIWFVCYRGGLPLFTLNSSRGIKTK